MPLGVDTGDEPAHQWYHLLYNWGNHPAMETLIIVLAVFAALIILGSGLLNKRNNDDQEPEE